ncbi:Kunitz-type trypsin inhibitor KTI1, partial [Mucuna pruriens]
MKSTTLLALFLLCVFTPHLASSTTDFVVDTDGDYLRNGGTYYVLPVIRGRGGGIEQALTGNETCPLTVVQSPLEVSKGLPLIISSPFRILYIYEGLILNIRFTFVPSCAPVPSTWTIVEGLPEGLAVKLTGYENTVPGWFKIKRASLDFNDYKLVFCARDDSTCGDIGIYIDRHGIRRLVVTQNDPLLVRFQKVTSSTA